MEGGLLPHRSNKQIKHEQTDVEYLKEALDLKLKSGYSQKYIKLLSYSLQVAGEGVLRGVKCQNPQ